MEVGLVPGHIVFDGDPAPPKKVTVPQFSAHVRCGQTAGWMQMPLGMEEPGDIVLHGDPAPLPKRGGGTAAPNFRAMYCGQTAGWIKMPLGIEVDLRPGHIALDRDPDPPKGHSPQFRPISIVAKRSPISATAEHLLNRIQVIN